MPLAPPDWGAIYPDTARPLIVDVGCGSGRFVLALSRRFQRHNLLGLDIRAKVRAVHVLCDDHFSLTRPVCYRLGKNSLCASTHRAVMIC